jgi:ribosomal protein L7Ae-like RNA K-turn-binding protein
VYKNENFLKKVVKKINRLEAEHVFIAGDFTYNPEISDLEKIFAPI